MSGTESPQGEERALQRIVKIREQIQAMDLVCSGTLLHRTKVCGKEGCRCKQDPEARHGPYYEWTRREQGRLAHSVLPADRAKQVARAIKNYRRILGLLREWETESMRLIRASDGRKYRK